MLRLALAVVLLVVVPGLLLINALLPPGRARLSRLTRGYLAVAGGILLLMLVGVVLGSLPHGGGPGTFASVGMGRFPVLELTLAGTCALLFYVGLRRGAYAGLAARWPTLGRLAAGGTWSAPSASQIR